MNVKELIEKHAHHFSADKSVPDSIRDFAVDLLEMVKSNQRAPEYDAVDKAL